MKKILQMVKNQQQESPTSQDLQKLLKERCKEAALALGMDLLEQEVEERCGKSFSRKGEGLAYRGGSEKSFRILDGGKTTIRRPRCRSSQGEVELDVLKKLQEQDILDGEIQSRMVQGISSRNYEHLIGGISEKLGLSKSSVSRGFVRASKKALESLNEADLSSYKFIGILVDGSEYAGRAIIGALGITDHGKKIPLGIREGDTENSEVVKDLLSSIKERGFTLACENILAILDGGKALKKGITDVFGDRVLIQRCYIHKMRNLAGYLPKTHHAQMRWRMKKLMNLVSYSEAKRELKSFQAWLENISYEAGRSLEEVGEELLTVHQLRCPRELRKTLSNTNAIESLMGVCRRKTRNVSNWKDHPKKSKSLPKDKILRWVATSIQNHRVKLRKLRGYKEIHLLIAALNGEKTKDQIFIETLRKEA